jgi:hypothetical protein
MTVVYIASHELATGLNKQIPRIISETTLFNELSFSSHVYMFP